MYWLEQHIYACTLFLRNQRKLYNKCKWIHIIHHTKRSAYLGWQFFLYISLRYRCSSDRTLLFSWIDAGSRYVILNAVDSLYTYVIIFSNDWLHVGGILFRILRLQWEKIENNFWGVVAFYSLTRYLQYLLAYWPPLSMIIVIIPK